MTVVVARSGGLRSRVVDGGGGLAKIAKEEELCTVACKLKVLKLAGSESLIKTPSFSEFRSLERLVLKDFQRLDEIDRSIGKLERLICLKIKWCPSLRELPEEIGHLTALRELILIQVYSVCHLPDSIGNLRLLSRLEMDNTGLVELPDTIQRLDDLEHLSLTNCTNLDTLSDDVWRLKSLKELDLSGSSMRKPRFWIADVLKHFLGANSFSIRTQPPRDLPLLDDVEDCWCPGRTLEQDGLVLSEDQEVYPSPEKSEDNLRARILCASKALTC
ncbi:disease resistance protein RUN1-like [Rhodamnia argentea]|uniref:Disease resistance protein RUN1-like n=1 Tax=Rhodamnia argentea TaxID=178133 RepID=A0ABM3HMW4_9MYRT|nr:disease resistance protein RUN1-like [Rhodamnia argentea]